VCKKISSKSAFSQIPLRWWKQLVQIVGEKNWADISNAELHRLAAGLTAREYLIEDKGSSKMNLSPAGALTFTR
jgi:hypothetical protein